MLPRPARCAAAKLAPRASETRPPPAAGFQRGRSSGACREAFPPRPRVRDRILKELVHICSDVRSSPAAAEAHLPLCPDAHSHPREGANTPSTERVNRPARKVMGTLQEGLSWASWGIIWHCLVGTVEPHEPLEWTAFPGWCQIRHRKGRESLRVRTPPALVGCEDRARQPWAEGCGKLLEAESHLHLAASKAKNARN